MKSMFTLLCTILVAFAASSRANAGSLSPYEFGGYPPTQSSGFPIDFGWITERYDFDRIEQYVDEYYATYYKHWERYLTSKQRELAGKFGLSDIFLKPNLKRYENTKIVFSKRLWDNRLSLRYLAPLGDVRSFWFSVALKPYRYTTFLASSHLNGESSIALVINRPFGNESGRAELRAKRLLGQAKRLINH